VKLVHKRLLALCTPYVLLIVGAALLHARFVEPRLVARLHREVHEQLTAHAAHVRQTVELATGQLRRAAQAKAFQGGDLQAIAEELRQWTEREGSLFDTLYFDDLSGSARLPDGQVVSVTNQAHYSRLAQGMDVVTDGRVSWTSPRAVFPVAVPVTNEAGNVVGAVGGELAANTLFSPLESDKDREDVLWVIEDTIGQKVTASSTTARNRPTVVPGPRGRQLPTMIAMPTDPHDPWSFESVVIPPMNWRLTKHFKLRDVLAPVRRFRAGVIALACVGLALTAAAVVWQDRDVCRRISELIEVVQRFGASDRSSRSSDQASDELGRLADAFNCMADDVVHGERRLRKELAEESPVAQERQRQIETLKAAVGELERFASSSAHDLKGPLATLEGYASGLEAAAKSEDWGRVQGDAQRIRSLAHELRATVEGLLERARSGQATPGTDDVSLHLSAQDAVQLLRGPIDASHVEVTVSPDLPVVKGDRLRWRQVFQNLIENAVRACDGTPSPRIEIGCERRGGQTCCYVRDNGTGLEPHEIEQLFDRLPAGPCDGTGIGLALVKRIVELHGGRVWAESEGKGRGTTVWVRLAEEVGD
jgi:signal transduction histidine kinase